jgi:hypothetical protein
MRHRPSHRLDALVLVLALFGCDEPAPAPAPPPAPTGPTCPAATVDVPAAGGFPTSEILERRARELVTRDYGADACVARVVVRRETFLLEATREGETIRAQLAASMGSPTESLAPHVAAQQLLRSLLDANVESAMSSGRGVALGLPDHAAACARTVDQPAVCVRTAPVLAFDSVTEPAPGLLVIRSLTAPSGARGAEWELAFTGARSLTTREGPIPAASPLGMPPPPPDRFARVHGAESPASPLALDEAAQTIAEAMPRGAITVRLETRSVGATRVIVLTRCEGMLAHCVSVVATREGTTPRVAPSFATDPARIDFADDASAFSPGALRVRIVEAGFHEGSASELFVVPSGSELRVHEVSLGHETERGDEETITEGCYRTLAIEAPHRVRLSDARGWSGSRSDARGWHVATNRTCALDQALCLDEASGFGPCS